MQKQEIYQDYTANLVCLDSNNGHFYTTDVEVVYTHLTSETSKPSGVDGNIDETEFSEKNEDQTMTLSTRFWDSQA